MGGVSPYIYSNFDDLDFIPFICQDLRNMAFGRQTGRIHKNSGSEQLRGKPREGEGWDEWKLRDTEVCYSNYASLIYFSAFC